MHPVWTITKRELASFFDSLLAYILLIAFLGFSGLFTWLLGADIFLVKQASLQSFFGVAYWSLFFFIPALTMRLIAEERSTGTLELILTKPVSDWQLVLGKFLSALLLIIISLALTLPYYITVAGLGPVDHGAVWTGYMGLLLMSAAYISIGLFASSVTSNQIVAFLLSLLIGIFFHFLFGFFAQYFPGFTGKVFSYLSLHSHYQSVTRGVVDTKDLVYFLSVIFVGLFAAVNAIAKRNVND